MASRPRPTTVYDSSLTADAPHFAPPTTPSRSPYKETLHRRSPTKQLRPGKSALDYDEYHKLVNSETSTAAEKELASRVVRAVERLKEWCTEIEQWGWSGSFDKTHGTGHLDPFQEVELSASLSQDEVEEYDSRLDAIDEQLRELDVDGLKEQILGIHMGRSRPSSSYSSQSLANLVLYDDFQLFVTETLMHTLPYHAKLKHYLRTWQIRLATFTEIPTYLDGIKFLEEILEEAWQGLKNASTSDTDVGEVNALEGQLETAQYMLKGKVAELGSQLDRMLDMLEGEEDRLPDQWIDKYEDNEKSYTDWSYEADRKLFQLRMLEHDLVKRKEMAAAQAQIKKEATVVDEAVESPSNTPDVTSVTANTHTKSITLADASAAATTLILHDKSSLLETDEMKKGLAAAQPGSAFHEENTATARSQPDESANVLVEAAEDGSDTHKESDVSVTKASGAESSAPVVIISKDETAMLDQFGSQELVVETQNDDINEVYVDLLDSEELPAEEEPVIAVAVPRPVEAALRRASVASIESFTRDQVKSVDVPSRRNSGASFTSSKRPSSRSFDSPLPSSPMDGSIRKLSKATSPLAIERTTEFPNLDYEHEEPRPQTPHNDVPTIRRNSVSSVATSASYVSEPEQGEESPSMRASKIRSAHLAKPPLNYAMKKRRSNNNIEESRGVSNPFSDQEILAINTPVPPVPPILSSQTSPTKLKSPISPSVPLEEQISTILESLPQRIRFRSGPSPSAADVKPKHKRKSSVSSVTSDTARQAIRNRAPTPSLSTRPTITLAPADDIPRRSSANDPEIKIYHLTSGNDKPLKLFVRRVGENGERVMVRVGGGWADLAEYLKNYADHHGHRAVSEGKVEVLGLGNDRAPTPTPGSGGRDSRVGLRSESRQEMRSDSRLGGRTDSRQGMRSDSRRSSLINSIGYPSIAAGSTESILANPTPTPVIHTPGPASDSFTPGSAGTGSQRRPSFWDDGGLMGPAASKKDAPMSEEKKEWVDSVVEQAKKVGRKVEFGDLGKKGGTRRVFLKGGRAVAE